MRKVTLGRIQFVTVSDDLKEPLGDQLEAVGAAVVAAERQAKAFVITLPLHGEQTDVDPRDMALRTRRQLRALLANAHARLQGLYFRFDIDPEINGWLLVGTGELDETEAGAGITQGEWKAALSNCYWVGGLRTHRPARRLEAYDRRLSTTARDYLGRLFSTDFAGESASYRHWLPVGASDIVGVQHVPLDPSPQGSIDGIVSALDNRPHGEVVHFAQAEADHGKADVLVLDRQGITAPAFTLAGDADPQDTYGWEEIYGPDQPLTLGDVPVVQNGFCRLRWMAAQKCFALDGYVAGSGYVEQARVSIWRDSPAGTETQYDTLIGAHLLEWTPERAVLGVRLGIGATDRADVYLTLERGWFGPRVEVYGSWTSAGKPGVAVRVIPLTAGGTTIDHSGIAPTAIVNGTTHVANFTGLQPWIDMLPISPNLALGIAVLQNLVKVIGRSSTVEYGSARTGLAFSAQDGTAIEGYVSVTLGVHARASSASLASALGQQNLYEARAVPTLVG